MSELVTAQVIVEVSDGDARGSWDEGYVVADGSVGRTCTVFGVSVPGRLGMEDRVGIAVLLSARIDEATGGS